jgi:kelch-like protein 20
VPVAPPATCDWCTALRRQREAGQFIDITLLVGRCKIPAHKTVLVGLSPYIEGLLTSGLAESKEGGDELKIGDGDTDGRAVEAIVDCFYSGKLSLSLGTVSSVIRTANLFGVGAVEKVACDFFVEALEPSTACEALAFAGAHTACGEHARGLHERRVGYMAEHMAESSAEPSVRALPCEAGAEVIGSDDLPVEEAAVTAARCWLRCVRGSIATRVGKIHYRCCCR